MHPEVIRVSDSITCVRRPSYFTCSYIVTTGSSIVLVDAGMKSDGSDVFYALDQLGRDRRDITTLLITHWHNDHAAGAAEIVEASGAKVVCTEAEAPYLRRDTAATGIAGWIADAVPEVGPFVLVKGLLGNAPMRAAPTDVLVADGDVVQGFEVIATPGHTDGHAAYYYAPDDALFAGDALALVDGQLRYMARRVTPDMVAARASMAKLLERDCALMCPGHRSPGPIDPTDRREFRARLADDEWPELG